MYKKVYNEMKEQELVLKYRRMIIDKVDAQISSSQASMISPLTCSDNFVEIRHSSGSTSTCSDLNVVSSNSQQETLVHCQNQLSETQSSQSNLQ